MATNAQLDMFQPNVADAMISMLQQYVPARARSKDPQTSFDAAASWTEHKLTATQMYVLSFFVKFGRGTDAQLEEWCAKTYPRQHFGFSSLRKRRGDLCEKGVLRDSGVKDSTRGMIIWEMKSERPTLTPSAAVNGERKG